MYALAVACAGLFVVLVLEVAARAFIDVTPHRFLLYLPSETGLYRLRPGFDDAIPIQLARDEPKVEIRAGISRQGLRDREYGPKVEGEFRILMMGDSQTLGWGLEKQDTVPKQLERMLEDGFPEQDIVVMNAGVPGYAPWQALAFLRDEVDWLQPDMVILQTFLANDLADTLEQLTPELHTLQAYPSYRPELVWRMRHHAAWPMVLDNWLLVHSYVYHVLWKGELFDTPCCRIAALLPWTRDDSMPRLPASVRRDPYFEPDLSEWYPELTRAWALFTEDLRAMAAYCREENLDFAVYNIPYPFDLRDAEGLSQFGEGFYTLDAADRRLEGFFRTEDYRHAETLALFREAPHPESLAFEANKHLSVKGAQMVAEEIRRQFLDVYLRERLDVLGGRQPPAARLAS